MKKECLFLGYDSKKTQLIRKIRKLKKKEWKIIHSDKPLSKINIKKFKLIICFGYRYIIKEKILKKLKKLKIEIINLHIGYLPYNRGAYPNFWSFIDNTPSGVTIHLINNKIDQGKIIVRKRVRFNLYKERKKLTFSNTYKILLNEVEKLFLKNISKIFDNKFNSYFIKNKGTYHNKADLPKILMNWDQNIYQTILLYKNI